MPGSTPIYWLVAEQNDVDFGLLQRACARISPLPELLRVKDGFEAKAYLALLVAAASRFGSWESIPFPKPALILSEVQLPLMDGLQLLAWAKDQPVLQKIPFLILSSSDAPQDRDRAQELGADAYLLKPEDWAGFASSLQAVLGDSER